MSTEPGDTRIGDTGTGARPDPAAATRRRLDQQAEQLRRFAERLQAQIHEAVRDGQPDREREALTRLRSVRARLEEITLRRGAVRDTAPGS